jgi:hypothetical protein
MKPSLAKWHPGMAVSDERAVGSKSLLQSRINLFSRTGGAVRLAMCLQVRAGT